MYIARMRALGLASCLILFAACHEASAPQAVPQDVPPAAPPVGAAHAADLVDDAPFVISRAGKVVGHEHWSVSRAADGSYENRFDLTLQLGDVPTVENGALRFSSDLSILSASTQITRGTQTSSALLSSSSLDGGAPSLLLTVNQPGEATQQIAEQRSSQVFVTNPSISGLFPLCRSALTVNQTLSLFPGVDIRILAVTAAAENNRDLTLDI